MQRLMTEAKSMMTIKYYLERLSEPSTWSAIVIIVGLVGYNMSDSFDADKWMQGAGAAVVLINIFWKKDTQSRK